MEFLKTLAREAESMTPAHSDTNLLSLSPPSCMLSSPLEALHAAVVMEMLTDELEILSTTVSKAHPELRSKKSITFDQLKNRPKFTVLPEHPPGEFSLVQHYSTVIPRRMMQGLGDMPYWSRGNLQEMMVDARIKIDTMKGKTQMDRTFLQLVADNTLRELLQTSTFTHLYKTIEDEKALLKKFWFTCLRLTYDKIKINRLKSELAMVMEEKWVKMKEFDQEIFKLKDQALEQEKRMQLELRLAEKQRYMIVKRFKRKHRQVLAYFHKQIAIWRRKLDLEKFVHDAMVAYLTKVVLEREILLHYWSEKYETDLTQLTSSLEELYEMRYRDIKRSAYIHSVIKRHEPIILSERRLKEIEVEKEKKAARELRSAIKIQAWWRGTMVRFQLGRFAQLFSNSAETQKDMGKGGPNKTDKKGKK